MNRNQALIEQFGEFRPYIDNKRGNYTITHGCNTSMEYIKMGLLGAYRFNVIFKCSNI